MSSAQLEERLEQELQAHVAEALGMSVEDVESLSFDVDTNESDDGLVYGHVLRFRVEECDPEALSRVPGLQEDFVMIAPLPDSSEQEYQQLSRI